MTQKTATRRGKFGRPNGISHNSFLALLRLESRISQKEVAIATHVSQPLVSNIEKGKTPADILYLYRLAELYAVPSFGEFCEKYLQDLISHLSPQSIKAASAKYQSISPAQGNHEQQKPSPTPSETEGSQIDERLNSDNQAQTPLIKNEDLHPAIF